MQAQHGKIALEASIRGIVAHGIEGFDYDRARRDLATPDTFDVMAMFAIGKKGQREKISPKLQEKEFPNDRKPLSEIVMEGNFEEKNYTP